jgi:hypothetical protein
MKIRSYRASDQGEVERIHRTFHKDGFVLPDFSKAIRWVVIEDNDGKLVAFAALNSILESIMILDLERTDRVKHDALKSLITTAIFTAEVEGYDQIHAFVQGEFAEKLKTHFSFKKCKGEALYFDEECLNG